MHARQQEAARPFAGGGAVDAEQAGRRKGRKGTWGRAGRCQKVGKDGQNGDAGAYGDCKVCIERPPFPKTKGSRDAEKVGRLLGTDARHL